MTNPLLQAFKDARTERLTNEPEPTAAKPSNADHNARVESLAKSLLKPAQASEIASAVNAAVRNVRTEPDRRNVNALTDAFKSLKR